MLIYDTELLFNECANLLLRSILLNLCFTDKRINIYQLESVSLKNEKNNKFKVDNT